MTLALVVRLFALSAASTRAASPSIRTPLRETALRSYADYVTYRQSTQGHLNADGLCAVQRRFASPR